MTDGDGEAGGGGETGQLDFPEPVAGPVGAAPVGAYQQPVGVGVGGPAHGLPPAAQSGNGEGGGVVVASHRGPGRDPWNY